MVETQNTIMEAGLSASKMSPGECRRNYGVKIRILKIDDDNFWGELQQFLKKFHLLMMEWIESICKKPLLRCDVQSQMSRS